MKPEDSEQGRDWQKVNVISNYFVDIQKLMMQNFIVNVVSTNVLYHLKIIYAVFK